MAGAAEIIAAMAVMIRIVVFIVSPSPGCGARAADSAPVRPGRKRALEWRQDHLFDRTADEITSLRLLDTFVDAARLILDASALETPARASA